MADLFGTYDKRIKLTVSNTNIDAELTWFPLTVFLTSAQGEEVFAEFDADTDFDRVAFTTSDESTQVYADCELFDDSESVAVYHIAKTGVAISNTGTTDFYMYYDDNADHNTTYISKSGGTAAQSVWDGDYEAVYHMADGASTSAIYDSTSNNNDGTKTAADNPIEVAGQVGLAQDFNGDDNIDIGSVSNSASWTIEGFVKLDVADANYTWLNRYIDFRAYMNADPTPKLRVRHDTDVYETYSMTNSISVDRYYYLVWTFNDTTCYAYIDGVANGSWTDSIKTASSNMDIGTASGYTPFKGNIGEVRISSALRSAAWNKATSNSLWDTLLTYGDEETGGVTYNSIMFGANF